MCNLPPSVLCVDAGMRAPLQFAAFFPSLYVLGSLRSPAAAALGGSAEPLTIRHQETPCSAAQRRSRASESGGGSFPTVLIVLPNIVEYKFANEDAQTPNADDELRQDWW